MTTAIWNDAKPKDTVTKRFGWNVYELIDGQPDQYKTTIHELRLATIQHSYNERDYIGMDTFDIRWQSTTAADAASLHGQVFAGRIDGGRLHDAINFGKLMVQVEAIQTKLSLHSPDERANFITALRSLGFVEVTRDRTEGHSFMDIASFR